MFQKKGNIFFSLTAAIFIFILSFNSTILYSQDCKSEITIKTNIPSSLIYFNNKFIGSGSIKMHVEKGKYPVLLRENKYGWNIEEINDTLVIDGCNEKKEFSYKFNNNFFINSSPQDAGVYISDSLIGYTPLNIFSTYSGLSIKKKEYEPKNLSSSLQDEYKKINLSYIGPKNSQDFLKTNLFKFLVGTAILFGGTSAYFKLKADDYFDQYNTTNMQIYLDKTHKYDTVSGILFGALQLNFAAIIYFFLTD